MFMMFKLFYKNSPYNRNLMMQGHLHFLKGGSVVGLAIQPTRPTFDLTK